MEFIKLHHELYSCSQTKEHITKDSDHIPCLACFEFKLGASVRVLEHYGEQFKTLVEQTEQCISVLQLQLWDTIVSLTELELTTTRATIASLYCKAVTALAIAFGFNASPDKMATKCLGVIYFTFKDPTVLKELTKHARMMLDTTDPVTSFFIFFPNTMATLIILPLTNTLTMNTHHLNLQWVYSSMPPKVYLSTLGMRTFLPNYVTQICKYAKSFHKEHSTTAIAMDIESSTVASKTILDFHDEKLVEEHKAFQENSIC